MQRSAGANVAGARLVPDGLPSPVAAEMYELFPRLRERRNVRAGSLSGGEQQMLAIARGLMAAPRLLPLDEPGLGLAPSTAQMLFEIIVEVRRRGITVCLVEQDVHSTLEIADYAYVLEDGAIVAEGLASEMPGSAQVRESYLGLWDRTAWTKRSRGNGAAIRTLGDLSLHGE